MLTCRRAGSQLALVTLARNVECELAGCRGGGNRDSGRAAHLCLAARRTVADQVRADHMIVYREICVHAAECEVTGVLIVQL